uniref:Low density lipoprotein receptor adaptor protein 1b n=1 Tax=Hucho hucho TaxID=62062 RepID=A0A4W5NTP9_9TELE
MFCTPSVCRESSLLTNASASYSFDKVIKWRRHKLVLLYLPDLWIDGRHSHFKLPENWTDTRETLLEGMVFQLKYLGVTLVEQPKGEELSAAAVKRIVATAKASGKKLQKVTLKVSPRGIILYDYASNQLIENISIYRISYCTADKMHDKVFAYIAQSQQNETLECHAYLCTKRKVAQAVTLTVAQAFRVAFEFWQAAKEDKEKRVKSGSDGEGASSSQSESSASLGSLKGGVDMFAFHCFTEVATGNLLDLAEGANMALVHSGTKESEPDPFMVRNHSTENNNTVWELEDGLDEAFSRLAESRKNPQVLDIGVNPLDFNTEECLSPTNWDKTDADNAEKDDVFGF